MTENPVKVLCRQKKMKLPALAILVGVDYRLLDTHANGRVARAQPRLLNALRESGIDSAAFERDYNAWFAAERAALREGLSGSVNATGLDVQTRGGGAR